MSDFTQHEGVAYWREFKTAYARAKTMQAKHPDCRVVPYELGWAIQREPAGPYWNERKGVWR